MFTHRKARESICILIAMILLLSAVPVYADNEEQKSSYNRFNVMIVMDSSNSMNYTDPEGYRFEAVRQFTNLLAKKGNHLGGIVFSNDIEKKENLQLSDRQEVKDSVVDALESIEPAGYTNIGAALLDATKDIIAHGDEKLPSVVLFLSDGNTEMESDEDLETSLENKADAIQLARENDIQLYTVCLNANSNADVTEMEQISDATDGVFKEVSDAEDLQDVFNSFYNLIYGTSTIGVVDEKFPSSGRIETHFRVPGIGVEEVNVIVYGHPDSVELYNPDGEIEEAEQTESDTFVMMKLSDVDSGKWTLVTEGTPGDAVKINMVYNTNLGIRVKTKPNESTINPKDSLTVMASLTDGEEVADETDDYAGYNANLIVKDAYKEKIDTIPMELSKGRFVAKAKLKEGSYYYQVAVSGNHLNKKTEDLGPLTVSSKAMTEAERNNTPPVAVEEQVKEHVYFLPFNDPSFTLDMNTLAEDEQDKKLKYTIASSSFIEGTDYSVNKDGILTLDHFSLKKGAFTIRATDSGGLYCDTEVIVSSHNIGIMGLIGLGIAGLIALIVFGIITYIAITKPFRGTITVTSITANGSRGMSRDPKRGRCKLSLFGLDSVGLDYSKSYFQATGQPYVYLISNVPVACCGNNAKKVKIQSGVTTMIRVNESDSSYLEIRFESRMKPKGRSGARPPKSPKAPKSPKMPKAPKRPKTPKRPMG